MTCIFWLSNRFYIWLSMHTAKKMNIAIIGSGVAGMAAGLRLAAKGHTVKIFEANDYPGGKLSEFYQHGFRFDAGPSLFTLPHLLQELLTLGDHETPIEFPMIRLEKTCNYFFSENECNYAYSYKRNKHE